MLSVCKLTVLMSALAAGTLATGGWTLPSDAIDGLYGAYEDADGNVQHEYLGNTSTIAARGGRFARRNEYIADSHGCEGTGTNFEDYATAINGLGTWCDDKGHVVYKHTHYSFISNGAAAYFCSQGGANQPCDSADLSSATVQIDANCGDNQGGWVANHGARTAYGLTVAGHDVCGQGLV